MALVQQSMNKTDFVLPVKVLTNKGYIKKLRYYDNESLLFKAYRQLKFIKSERLIPLYPVVYGIEFNYND